MTDKQLNDLIYGLEQYAAKGIYDPWVFEDGTEVQPLDALKELRELREYKKQHER